MKTKPYAHQQRVLDTTWDLPYYALFMDQGTGKTKITIDTFDLLRKKGRSVDLMVVVAPNGVQRNWVNKELPIHGSGPVYATHVYRGMTTKAEAKEIKHFYRRVEEGIPGVFAINIEALRPVGKKSRSRAWDLVKDLMEEFHALMVVDESTIIKNPKAKQTEAVLDLSSSARFRRILSGTPLAQSPLDAWSQMTFLNEKFWPHGSWTAFKADFAIESLERTAGNKRYFKVQGYRNLDKLQSLISRASVRITKEECLDLPPKTYMIREVDLTGAQKKAYEELRTTAMTMIRDEMVTASNALSLLQKFHRITLGHIVTDDGEEHELPTNRLSAIGQIVGELPIDEKIIIWAYYKTDMRRLARFIREDMGMHGVLYYGDVSNNDREMALDRFRTNDACRFFIANKAASRGLTLTEASTVIYYSNSYSLEDRLQSEDRNHRIGQDRKVVYHDLMVPDTVDEKIYGALRNKRNLSSELMKGITKLQDLI